MAARSADVLNRFTKKAHEILIAHPVNLKRVAEGLPPANVVITRGAGMHTRMRSLTERFHINGACVAGESTILGVSRLAGFDTFTNDLMTSNLDTDTNASLKLQSSPKGYA